MGDRKRLHCNVLTSNWASPACTLDPVGVAGNEGRVGCKEQEEAGPGSSSRQQVHQRPFSVRISRHP